MIQLTVVIPVFNEERTIVLIIERLLATLGATSSEVQYIIVDDGSTDTTKKLLETSKYFTDHRFYFIFHPQNQGKGAAIRSALPQVRGTYVIVQDADLEYSPSDIPALLNYAKKHNSKVVYGSRNLKKDTPHGGLFFYWGGRLLTSLANILFGQQLTDEPCGYKLFTSELLLSLPLTCKRFEFCPEVTALISERGIHIAEVAISYAPRSKTEGKKISYRDGITAVKTFLRIKCTLRKEWTQAFLIFLFTLGIFFVSWNGSVAGYEPDTIDAATALTKGVYVLKKPAIGSSLLYIPFVYISKIIPTIVSRTFLTLVPIFYSAVTMALLFLIANRLQVRRSVSILVTLIIAVGSLVWPYSKLGMEYQEMFFIALTILALLQWQRNRTISLLFPGAALALLALSKSYGIIFVVPTLLFVLVSMHGTNSIKDIIKPAFFLRLLGPAFFVMIFILVINLLFTGRLTGTYKTSQEFQLIHWWEGVWGIFFGFGKSILVYNPLLILAAIEWRKFFKQFTAVGVFVLTGFVLYFIITAPFSYWSDETPSVRKLVPLIPFLHLPLYFLIDRFLVAKRKIALALTGLLVALAIYIQIINSFYTYYRYLIIARSGNVDTLEQMRYNPNISQVYINHLLLISYIKERFGLESGRYVYQEKTWMRHFNNEGAKDFKMIDFSIDLHRWNTPSIYFLTAENKNLWYIVLSMQIVLLGGGGVYLISTVATMYKEESLRK